MKAAEHSSLRILIVEDNRGDIALIETYLDQHIQNGRITAVHSFKEAQAILDQQQQAFDIILLDLSLPDKSGEMLITDVISMACACPVIVLTGHADITFSVRSLSLGVADYLVKDEINAASLYKSVLYNIERKKILNTIERQNTRLREIAWIQSHLVRAPLAKIMGLIDIIETHNVPEVEKAALLTHVLNAAKEFDKVITEILDKTDQIEINGDANDLGSNNCR